MQGLMLCSEHWNEWYYPKNVQSYQFSPGGYWGWIERALIWQLIIIVYCVTFRRFDDIQCFWLHYHLSPSVLCCWCLRSKDCCFCSYTGLFLFMVSFWVSVAWTPKTVASILTHYLLTQAIWIALFSTSSERSKLHVSYRLLPSSNWTETAFKATESFL